METTFTPISALIGGILIGLSAVLLMLINGRIAGISGIVGGLLAPQSGETGWRIAFVLGLLAGPLLYAVVVGGAPPIAVTPSAALLVAGGLLVGYGTRLGRSEEHTSELQSLMRSSYAVFCLKKKNNK